MADPSLPVEIPKRALFKAAEVCDLVKLQPYVLRSWETEFPDLGVTKAGVGPRVYRRSDVEQVLRIKHLLLVEGLTLAGARRKLGEEATPVAPDASIEELIGQNARDRLTEVKRGLRSILDLLSKSGAGETFALRPPARPPARPAATPISAIAHGRAESARGKGSASRERPAARRKRSA